MNRSSEHDAQRFRILVCIDGSEESYRSLRYAAKMGKGVEADLVLLYVRPKDQGLRSGGLEVRVARENMLNWGLELPGIQYLKKGKDILVDVGYMASDRREDWDHVDVVGDPLGDNKITFVGRNARKVILKLKVSSDVANGILEQWELGHYDIIILGAAERWERKRSSGLFSASVAETVAAHAPCPVLIARQLMVGHSHLIYADGTDLSKEVIRKDAEFAYLTESLVAIIGVAPDEDHLEQTQAHVEEARAIVEGLGIEIYEAIVRVGDPVAQLIEAGADHSVIVVPDFERKGLRGLFSRNVLSELMRKAKCSVLVFR